jgi:TDG/mug DNA glycosylase family protein
MVIADPVDLVRISDLASSFPPVFEADAQVLVLGSMPGRASLQVCQYYAHPHNAFWPIIENLFGVADGLDYIGRTGLLLRHRIALWDVLKTCRRNGSLDSSIRAASIIPNDFGSFYRSAPDIKAVFFNGATAEREYRKRVVPMLPEKFAGLPTHRLPSTSPAMAGIPKEEKLERWRLIADVLRSAVGTSAPQDLSGSSSAQDTKPSSK